MKALTDPVVQRHSLPCDAAMQPAGHRRRRAQKAVPDEGCSASDKQHIDPILKALLPTAHKHHAARPAVKLHLQQLHEITNRYGAASDARRAALAVLRNDAEALRKAYLDVPKAKSYVDPFYRMHIRDLAPHGVEDESRVCEIFIAFAGTAGMGAGLDIGVRERPMRRRWAALCMTEVFTLGVGALVGARFVDQNVYLPPDSDGEAMFALGVGGFEKQRRGATVGLAAMVTAAARCMIPLFPMPDSYAKVRRDVCGTCDQCASVVPCHPVSKGLTTKGLYRR